MRAALPGDLLQRLVACPGPQLRQSELLLRRLMCALLPRAAAAASMTSSADLQAQVQAAEVVLAITDWDRWTKAGMDKDHAWCARCLRSCETGPARSLTQVLWCWIQTVPSAGGCSARSRHLECSKKLPCFFRYVRTPAGIDRGCMPSIVRPDPPLVHAIQNRPVHLPLLVSVVGLSLRPVFLGVPRTAEVDQCRIRFCTSVACVPKLVDSVPSAMASMFRRPRLWAALLPAMATSTSMSGLPVLECVPCHLVWTSSTCTTL